MSRILMVASEAAPYAKTGGLADVLGALPQALRELGHEVTVLLPRYAQTKAFAARRVWDNLLVRLGNRTYSVAIFQSESDAAYLFLDFPEFYDRPGLYGEKNADYPDNHLRFGLLARAALEVVRRLFAAEIIHCHDWQTALLPAYLRTLPGDPTFTGICTLTTIHNMAFQGLFPAAARGELGLPASIFHREGAEFYGNLSFLKAALMYSDALSTVSRRYAEEIQTPEYGAGLDGVLRKRSAVLHGILNGVDYAQWNPETDALIPATYSAADLAGKQICKRELLRESGLPEDAIGKPLIGIVSRFTDQKGADLIGAAANELFAEDVCLTALGSGDPVYEKMFRDLAETYPDRVAVRVGYDEAFAHRIEAGADIFLMPSRFEPCGLNQIYSLRYGTVPVVRATGGLDDTINETTGFKFAAYSIAALLGALREAIAAYRDRPRWTALIKHGMAKDYSWTASAREYGRLYRSLLNPEGR
jgi:starch synthase